MTDLAYNLPNHRTCPKCDETATMTDWRPAAGLDPTTREYKCTWCHNTWFHIPRNVTLKYVSPNKLH